jgi:hypothetical protein
LNFFVLKKRWQKKLKRKRLTAPNFLRSGKVAMEDNGIGIGAERIINLKTKIE